MTTKKPISVAARKAKGRKLQKWVAEKISELTGFKFGKDEMIASREMGQSGTDIRLIGPAKEAFKFSVECKFCETLSIPKWIEQAKANKEEETDWLLFFKRSHKEPIVVLDAEVFFKILKDKKND